MYPRRRGACWRRLSGGRGMPDWLATLAMRIRRSAFAFPLAVLVAGLMLGISELGYQTASSQLAELADRVQTRLQLSRLMRRIADAESGQRGFLLTGHPEYLAPFADASIDAVDSLTQLKRLIDSHGDAAARTDLVALDRHARNKLGEMDEVLSLYKSGRQTTAHELMMSGLGRDSMEGIRSLTDKLTQRENGQVALGLGYIFDTLLLNRIGVATMTAISLLVLGMYLRQRRQSDSDRQLQQRELRAERDRLEQQVQHRTQELTELARHLETAREDERARLARDLHDELGALLTAAKLDVARMRPKLAQAAPELMPRMVHLVEALNSGIALKRRIIEDLRPSSLSNLGLLPALDILCREFGERLTVPVQTQLSPVSLIPTSELTVFRLVQESLNNIAKHAQASRIEVELSAQGDEVAVCIRDNGVGFDAGAVGTARHGLVGMRYRVQAEGGRLLVSSAPGHGTELRAWLPTAPAGLNSP